MRRCHITGPQLSTGDPFVKPETVERITCQWPREPAYPSSPRKLTEAKLCGKSVTRIIGMTKIVFEDRGSAIAFNTIDAVIASARQSIQLKRSTHASFREQWFYQWPKIV